MEYNYNGWNYLSQKIMSAINHKTKNDYFVHVFNFGKYYVITCMYVNREGKTMRLSSMLSRHLFGYIYIYIFDKVEENIIKQK